MCVFIYSFTWLCWVLVGMRTISFSMWDLVPCSGIKLAHPLQWEIGVSATRPLGKSLYGTFFLVLKTALPLLLFPASLILHWTMQF